MAKKVVKKKAETKIMSIKEMSTADLYALYIFVSNDGNNRGFGMTSPKAKDIVRGKQKELENELYIRAYGYNPFEEHKVVAVHEGVKPEDIDLDKVLVVTGDNKEPKDEKPDTFIVVKNPEENKEK